MVRVWRETVHEAIIGCGFPVKVDGVFELVCVDQDSYTSSAEVGLLSANDGGRNAFQWLCACVNSTVGEMLHAFLECCARKQAAVRALDIGSHAVSRNRADTGKAHPIRQ